MARQYLLVLCFFRESLVEEVGRPQASSAAFIEGAATARSTNWCLIDLEFSRPARPMDRTLTLFHCRNICGSDVGTYRGRKS